MRGLRKSMLLGLLLAAGLPSSPAQSADKGFVVIPTVYRVGAFGPPCTHTTLAAALADAPALGVTVIRLADNQTYSDTNINITERIVTIEGGYTDCSATSSSGDRTVLTGAPAAGDSVIEVSNGDLLRTVVLRHLEIRGGTPDGDGGGGLQVQGETDITLENVRFEDNSSTAGGAIRLLGTALDPVELRVPFGGPGAVVIINNSSTGDGGGIRCESAAIRVAGTLAIASNSAAGSGGGADLSDCVLAVGLVGDDPAEILVNQNNASSGGGLHADAGSTVMLRGARADFISNRAQGSGGGIRLSGSGTTMDVSSLYMSFNHVLTQGASPSGGAIGIGHGAALTVGQNSEPCRALSIGPTRACNTIRNSYLDSGIPLIIADALGGAIVVRGSTGTRLTLAQTYIGGNQIVPAFASAEGAAIYVDDGALGGTARLELESVIFDGNTGADSEVMLEDGADAEFGFVTFNFQPTADPVIRTASGSTLELHSSLSLANTLIDVSGGGFAAGSCNFLGSGDDSLASIDTATPDDFVDAANGDLRLSTSAVMRDRCSDEQFEPQFDDALNQLRPIDVPELPNSPGPYDAGAYEFNPVTGFADGFESP